jgi:hypothetical protein
MTDRLTWLASDENPDRDSRSAYRALLDRRAAGDQPQRPAPLSVRVDYGVADVPRRSCCG